MAKDSLLGIVTGFRKGLLGSKSSDAMCYAVCFPLSGLLDLYGYNTRLVEDEINGGNHYWLELPDGRIIDPTADQFSTQKRPMPPFYIGRRPRWYKQV